MTPATPMAAATGCTPSDGSGEVDHGLPAAGHLGPAQGVAGPHAEGDDVVLRRPPAACAGPGPRRTWSWRTTHPSGMSTPASAQASDRLAAGRVHQADRHSLGVTALHLGRASPSPW